MWANWKQGTTPYRCGHIDEELHVQRESAERGSKEYEAHFSLAAELRQRGLHVEAETHYRAALAKEPNRVEAYTDLGSMLRELGRLDEAEQMCQHAIALDATAASALMALGNVLEAQGRQAEAQVYYYRADMVDDPMRDMAHSRLLCLLNRDVNVTPEVLALEMRAYGHIFEEPAKSARIPHTNKAIADKRLRMGFVSGDYCNNALAGFLKPVFEALARSNPFECHAYSTRTLVDGSKQRMQTYFHAWHEVAHLSNPEFAELIRNDGIDILVDLSGHTDGNRLAVFALKPAPVQISWFGFLGSTGLTGMDYYLCDEQWLPPASQRLFTETLAYLPNAVVFEPHGSLPSINESPALSNGFLTFGSFNCISKINDSVVALWAEILRRAPTSRLVLAGIEVDWQVDLLDSFLQQGVDASRLTMHPPLAEEHEWELLQVVDVCLDTFPHSGGATTANAICMGVPTLSLCGESAASRFGGSIMCQAGLPEFVTYSISQFVEAGVYWAEHPEHLVSVRGSTREAFLQSPLADYDGFAAAFSASTRIMWKRWCASTRQEFKSDNASIGHQNKAVCAAPPQLFGKLNAPYYVVTPPFRQTSGGIRAMHYLCHALNLIGQEAYVDTSTVATYLRTPVLTEDIKAFHVHCGRKPIVIYPEVVNDNPLNAEHVVRYLLNNAGKINYRPLKWQSSDLIYSHGVDIIPSGVHAELLQIPLIDRSVYFNRSIEQSQRKGALVFINRYLAAGGVLAPITQGATEISFRVPSRTPQELADLYSAAEVLYTYEQSTCCYEAMLCGCPVVYIPNPVLLTAEPVCHLGRGGWAWGTDPEQLAFAKASIHQIDLTYQEVESYFWNELAYFVALTQARTKRPPNQEPQALLLPAKDPLGAGIKLYDRNDLDEALWQLLEASNHHPTDALPFVYIALVCARKGMAQQATEFLDHALSLAPGRNDFYAALGEAFLKAGCAEDALPFFESALRNDPDLSAAYPAYAQSLRLLGRNAEAVQFLEQKLFQNGGTVPVLSELLAEFK
jgi:predicted O-linked N-acetylglucosamine transferase (SPINDLY family)